ncbi:MAG: OB-fold domain-containing protein [Burkholderiaceae bacterium]
MYPTPSTSARSYFLAGLENQELRYQYDPVNGRSVLYPREVAPSGQLGKLEWRVSQGKGTIYSYTEVHRSDEIYNIVLVDLAEGFRVMSTIPDAPPGSLFIGQVVQADFDAPESGARLIFKVVL